MHTYPPLVRRVHLLVPMKNMAVTKMKRIDEFTKMKQRREETLREYMNRFTQAVDGMKHAEVGVPEEDVQTARFIDGLDGDKFAEMKRSLYNDSLIKSGSYPKTLIQAMTIAQQLSLIHI